MNEQKLYFKSSLATKFINLKGDKHYSFRNILVIKLDEIGDMVTAFHVFHNLREKYQLANITVYCKPFNSILFKHMNHIKVVNTFSDIENEQFDLIVDLRGDEQTLQYALSKSPKYRLDRGTIRFRNKFVGGQKYEIDTNSDIIRPLIPEPSEDNRIPLSDKEYEKVNEFLDHENIQDFAVLHISARHKVKQWPVKRFSQVMDYINSEYGLPCILIGSKEDIEMNKACLDLVKSKSNFSVAGDFNLLEFVALCTKAKLYIGNDSGPLHLAASTGVPLIALFSNAVKIVWYPKVKQVKIHHYFLAKNHEKQTVENSTIFNIKVDEVKESVDYFLK